MHFTADEVALAIGRLLLGVLYVRGGVSHFFEVPMLVERMTARGVPMARFTLILGSIFQIACGLLVMAGIYTLPAACGLVVFTLLASFMFLNFWEMEGAARYAAKNSWFSNLALIGACLILATR